jgi:DNA polymerase III alpha subunit (gram-positive type)
MNILEIVISYKKKMKYLIVAFDLESTGLSVYHDRIIQIAACSTVYNTEDTEIKFANRKTDQFERYVKIPFKLEKIITEKTRITDEILEVKGVDINEALREFFDWMSEVYKKEKEKEECRMLLIAHNGFSFDYPLLFSEMHVNSFSIKKRLENVYLLLDTYAFARSLDDTTLMKIDGKPSRKLGDLYRLLTPDFKEMSNAHNALYDTKALCELACSKLFSRMYSDIEKQDWCDTVDNFIRYKFSAKREEADKKNLEDIKKLVCGSTRKRKLIEDFFGDSSVDKKKKDG